MKHLPLYYQSRENLHDIVKEVGNPRLTKAFRRLKESVEQLFDPALYKMYDKVLARSWVARKSADSDDSWEVPDEVYDYHTKCDEVVRSLQFLLAAQGLAPTQKKKRR